MATGKMNNGGKIVYTVVLSVMWRRASR